MRNNSLKLIFLSCLAAAGNARADSTADNLTRIEAETLILKAQERQIQVKAQIAAREAEIASRQSESDKVGRNAGPGDPVIRAIEGIGNTLYATLALDNGSTVDVRSGSTLPNGMKVLSIRQNEVIVQSGQRDKRQIRLALFAPLAAGNGGNTIYPSYPGATVALPPLQPALPSKGAAQ
ncbi:putative exported protein [Collimonas arenae]|uniref:Putative exported protein n=1 Tax=Collimonas arenae TaxID=279058 RepID=A0A0A1F764_9BURK|nr:type IV pilus biogenesis protein PilP [Collimonas arenae]AIY39640.1 putative exported protein [Collimonas arenae]